MGASLAQVTPSSKVVGDLAQFMVQNNLDQDSLVEKAEGLSLPTRWGPPYFACKISMSCPP